MKTKSRVRFEIDAVRNLAGGKVFARGEAYFRNGQVRILAIDRKRVLAEVAGSEDYRTVVAGRGRSIKGECSCPAFGDWGFCKHMVATALAANTTDGSAEAEGAFSRIRDHLKTKGVDALVEIIVDLAENDAALFHKLDLAATIGHADDKTIEARLRKAINGATRTGDFIDYQRARSWAAGVDAALGSVADLISGGRAGLVRKLAEHAIERIERAVESIDDSDGHCATLLGRARDIHVQACVATKSDRAQLARDLFTREMEDDYGAFDGAVALYAEALGKEGLAEYRRLAVEAWDKLPTRAGAKRAQDEFLDSYRLRGILDFFAEREGDVDRRIALRAKELTSPWDYFELARFCIEHGHADEALRRAEEGLWMFEDDDPDEQLVFLAADLLIKAGRKSEAEAHLWGAFERAPSLDLYRRLRKLGGEAARERAIERLEAQATDDGHADWDHPADLLISILVREKMFAEAWSALRKHQASSNEKVALAKASEASYPVEALEIYAERVDQLANRGDNQAYAEAAAFIARMNSLRSAAEQTTYVAELKARFGRKRNFMKLLG